MFSKMHRIRAKRVLFAYLDSSLNCRSKQLVARSILHMLESKWMLNMTCGWA